MKIFLILTLMYSTNLYALVESGQQIKAIQYNNSTFTIGDIKTSLLTLSEFQTLHGNCWIQLNQSNTDINISGSDLANLKGISQVKSSAGRVLRSQGGESLLLGQQQDDAFKAHNHGGGDHNHSLTRGNLYGRSGVTTNSIGVGGDNTNYGSNPLNNSGTIIQTEGANETRMKNLTVNTFVKINHACN